MTRDNDSLQVPTFRRSTSGPSTASEITTKQAKATKKGGFLLWGDSAPSSEASNNGSPDSTSIVPSRQASFALTDGNQAASHNETQHVNGTSKFPSRKSSAPAQSPIFSPHVSESVSFTSVTSGHQRGHALQAGQLQAKLATLEAPPEEVTDKDSEVDSRDSSRGDGVTVK